MQQQHHPYPQAQSHSSQVSEVTLEQRNLPNCYHTVFVIRVILLY